MEVCHNIALLQGKVGAIFGHLKLFFLNFSPRSYLAGEKCNYYVCGPLYLAGKIR